jgi:hypothetical protein
MKQVVVYSVVVGLIVVITTWVALTAYASGLPGRDLIEEDPMPEFSLNEIRAVATDPATLALIDCVEAFRDAFASSTDEEAWARAFQTLARFTD